VSVRLRCDRRAAVSNAVVGVHELPILDVGHHLARKIHGGLADVVQAVERT